MPRYVKDLPTQIGFQQAGAIINEYLTSEGFQYVSESGEPVWRKGVGAVTVPQFLKVLPGERVVHIEAWLAGVAFLPGLYTGEMGLDGLWGFAIKAALRKRVEELERRLTAALPLTPPPPPPAAATAAAVPPSPPVTIIEQPEVPVGAVVPVLMVDAGIPGEAHEEETTTGNG